MKAILFTTVMALTANMCVAQIGLNAIKNQAGNALSDAVERKLDQEMNKMADKAVNKYWDRIIGKYYNGAFEGSAENGGPQKMPFSLDANVTTESSYSFNSSAKMKIETYTKKGKLDETMYMTTYATADGTYLGTELPQDKGQKSSMFMINDFKNSAMIILMDNEGEKMSLAYKLTIDEKAVEEIIEENTETYEPPKIEKLGTKSILGYTCQGYKYVSEDTESEIWVTESNVMGMQSIFSMQGQKGMQGKKSPKMPDNYPTGAILEVTAKDLKSGEKTVMQVVEVNKSASVTKNMSEYPRMGVPTGE